MADNKTDNLTPQLDNTEKYGIITDEELEEIGAFYGSREKYKETMRYLAGRLSGTQTRRHASVTVGMGRAQAGIDQETSTVPLGDLSGIKKINIAGKVINTAGDAALLLSSFRDPRIEIFNIVYTSKTGEILAHTAWTNGLPGFVNAIDKPSPGESLGRILKIKENLNAEKIWIAHNHPSGDPAPSDQDIGATRLYASHFGHSFVGHIVLDHDKYTFIFPDGMSYEYELKKPSINFISTIREQAETIKSPARFASIFKEILSGNEDVTAYAILDNAHKIVSWVYGNSDNTSELKNYMRISGGAVVVALTNNETAYRKIFNDACNAFGTNKDIFLDVIKVDRSTGITEKCLAQKVGTGGEWQLHESKQVKYIINNPSINVELKLDDISNNNPSVYEDQEKFYIKNDVVKQISKKEQIMEKRIILAKADEELTPKQMALFTKDVNYIEAMLKAEEQNDWNRVDQILKERQDQPDAIKSLRTNDYKQLISAWEKEARREAKQINDQKKIDRVNQLINEKSEVQADGSLRISSEDWRGINRKLNEGNIEKNKLFEDALRNIANEDKKMENFWRVRYLVDTKKQEKTSDINQITSFEGKPKPEFLESGSLIQYSEYFNSSDEPVAYKKMQSFITGEFTESLKSLLEKRNINSKENFMSENTYYPKANRPSKEDEAVFHKALHERKVIMEALKNGTLSCLPGTDGYADTAPAFNLMSDKNYHGDTLLYIKEHQKQNGYPTAEYITEYRIEKAKQDYPEIALKKDQKPVSFYVNELDNETQKYEPKEIKLFNIAQTTNPQLLKDWVIEQEEKKIEQMKTQFSESYKPSEPKQKSPAPESITCTSTDPEKYLGQYLAAVSLNSKFKVSPEQAAEFTQKLENTVYERMENGHTHPFKLSKIASQANEECRNVIRDIKMDTLKQQSEQTPQQEQTQSRGHKL